MHDEANGTDQREHEKADRYDVANGFIGEQH
jgi:hypothetical protein